MGAGVVEVKMTQQGANMTDGDIMEWFVSVGDRVEKGDDIARVEAAKATFNISAPVSGVIASIDKEQYETVLVGEVIATIKPEE